MMTLIDEVRFNVAWEHRNDPVSFTEDRVTAEINAMTPLQLLQHINDVLEAQKERAA